MDNWKLDGQIDRKMQVDVGRQAGKQADRQTDKQTEKWTEANWRGGLTDGQVDKWTGGQMER